MYNILLVVIIGLIRKCLRDGLKISNQEDLHGITVLSLLLLGNTFLVSGEEKVCKTVDVEAAVWYATVSGCLEWRRLFI